MRSGHRNNAGAGPGASVRPHHCAQAGNSATGRAALVAGRNQLPIRPPALELLLRRTPAHGFHLEQTGPVRLGLAVEVTAGAVSPTRRLISASRTGATAFTRPLLGCVLSCGGLLEEGQPTPAVEWLFSLWWAGSGKSSGTSPPLSLQGCAPRRSDKALRAYVRSVARRR